MLKLFLVISLVSSHLLAADSAVPPEVKQQWRRFQEALKTDNITVLAAMSKFPIKSNEFGIIKSPKALGQQYNAVFSSQTKKALIASPLRRSSTKNEYEAFTETGDLPLRFLFDFSNSKLRLYYIDNTNE